MDSANDAEDKMDVLPSTETDTTIKHENLEESSISEPQWGALRDVIHELLEYREEDGHDPSKVFLKKVNKRNLPSYYEIIKEPIAFSSIRASLASREYKDIKSFVRDCALIWHNAHTYNRPDAGAYQDASTMKRLMEEQFRSLVAKGIMTADEAEWPDLGEIPPVEEVAADAEEDDEDDEEEEDEDADDSDDGRHRRGARRRRSSITATKGSNAIDVSKKRGRPPKVDTPMEARIKNIIKGLKRVRDDQNVPRIYTFERLPDKALMPEYYLEIKNPMSIELIKRSLKRKRYRSVEDAMRDIELMFENAKAYNEDESDIFKSAVLLQQEARQLAEIEKAKDDTELDAGEGRKPRPEGIIYKDERWAVGDWVHIKNPNDATKPIVAQIYRTWEDLDGQEWFNACWYYKPEQIVHHYEKHFWPNEVLKTGQYRDHRIEELIDHCFVMFYTRFTRGRPRGISHQAEVYVCEARYNEEKHKVNKIKTWASCLPDEVRDRDYEMDLFDGSSSRRVKKLPSPLLPMYKDKLDKLSSNPPKAQWGAENAPPILGGLFGGPRDENQSPPPEATPEPTPQQLAMRAQHASGIGLRPGMDHRTSDPMHRAHIGNYSNPGAATYSSQHGLSRTPAPATPTYQYPGGLPRNSSTTQLQQINTAANNARYSTTSQPAGVPHIAGAFVLPSDNDAIPEEIRREFHTDEQGNIIFFSQPPVRSIAAEDVMPKLSLKFRAARLRRRIQERDAKQKEAVKQEGEPAIKKQKVDALTRQKPTNKQDAFKFWQDWINDVSAGTENIYKTSFPTRWQEIQKFDKAILEQNLLNAATREQPEQNDKMAKEKTWLATRQLVLGKGIFKDDFDSRF